MSAGHGEDEDSHCRVGIVAPLPELVFPHEEGRAGEPGCPSGSGGPGQGGGSALPTVPSPAPGPAARQLDYLNRIRSLLINVN